MLTIDAPCTLTLMGLGAFPASDPRSLGMLGMHGTLEANLAMHEADLVVCVGARFDDRVTDTAVRVPQCMCKPPLTEKLAPVE
jgi:thiamine pyrophosphate-dependent acetolactate synthase large subunit-like protein